MVCPPSVPKYPRGWTLPDPSSGPYPGHPSLSPQGGPALVSLTVGLQYRLCLWGLRLHHPPLPPCNPLPGKQPPHPDPRGGLTLPHGPDFLSKVTLGATGAQWPIKPIDAERETVKQVNPRGHLLSPPPAPLRACGPGTCKQCGGSVAPAAVPSLCWVRRAVARPGCIPRPTVPCPRPPGLTFLLEHSCPGFPTGSQGCLALTSSHSVSHPGLGLQGLSTLASPGHQLPPRPRVHGLPGISSSTHWVHQALGTHTGTHMSTHALTHRHTHSQADTCTHIHTHTFTHIYTQAHARTEAHTHTHSNTGTHAHTLTPFTGRTGQVAAGVCSPHTGTLGWHYPGEGAQDAKSIGRN